jgi:hypothetical protein
MGVEVICNFYHGRKSVEDIIVLNECMVNGREVCCRVHICQDEARSSSFLSASILLLTIDIAQYQGHNAAPKACAGVASSVSHTNITSKDTHTSRQLSRQG